MTRQEMMADILEIKEGEYADALYQYQQALAEMSEAEIRDLWKKKRKPLLELQPLTRLLACGWRGYAY